MNNWLLAALAILVGTIVGIVLSRIVAGLIASPKRPEAIRGVAKPLAGLAFAIGLVGGLIAALGFVQPDALEQLPKDVVAFVPKVLTAAIIIIVANVLASFAVAAIDQTTARMPAIQKQATLAVKATIFTLAALLAVSQIGIDTEVVNMGVAAVFFGIAASLTLLVGLGGHGVAREVASTRAVRRMLNEGDSVQIDDVRGEVQTVYPTAVEIATPSGELVMIPSSRFLNENVSLVRATNPTATTTA